MNDIIVQPEQCKQDSLRFVVPIRTRGERQSTQDTNAHHGRLPELRSMRSSLSANIPVLETVLEDYCSNPEIFRCPADRKFFKKSGSSYAWNNVVSGTALAQMDFFGSNNAAKIPLVGDKEAFHGDKDGTNLLYGDFRSHDEVKFSTGGGALNHVLE